VDSVGTLTAVKETLTPLSETLLSIRSKTKVGNNEAAGAELKAAIGDYQYLAKDSKGLRQIAATDTHRNSGFGLERASHETLADDAFGDDLDLPSSLDDIPNAMLAELFTKNPAMNEMTDFVSSYVESLGNLDLSIFRGADDDSSQPYDDFNSGPFGAFQFDADPAGSGFGFGGSNFGNQYSAFNGHSASFKDAVHQHLNGFSLPEISKFLSVDDYDIVMAKHELRKNHLGDVCLPQCNTSEWECNCKKLYGCVQNMSEYDLATLTAGGFIDTNKQSKTHGEFRVPINELRLFDTGIDIRRKLQYVKNLTADGNAITHESCANVLEEFHASCNPNEDSCSQANQQSFQVTTEQVCNAVNNSTKLKFSAIGAGFDRFDDESSHRSCEPLSYDTCADFAVQLDRLYAGRDSSKYPHPNPMLKNPDENHLTSDMPTGFVLDKVQLPYRYNFNQDDTTGIVKRTFEEDAFLGGASLHQKKFSLVNSKSGKALTCKTVEGGSPRYRLAQEKYDKSSTLQQFKLNVYDQLESVGCAGKVIEAMPIGDTFQCKGGIGLSLEANDGVSSEATQQWRFYNYGIVNVACGAQKGNLTISAVENYDTMKEIPHKGDVTFSLVNPFNGMAITAVSESEVEKKSREFGLESAGVCRCSRGFLPCYDLQWQNELDIGDCSCNGDAACVRARATIKDHSCDGKSACNQASCYPTQPDDPCPGTKKTIGSVSCIGEEACAHIMANVGNNACHGPKSCYEGEAYSGSDIPHNCPSLAAIRQRRCNCNHLDCYCGGASNCQSGYCVIPQNKRIGQCSNGELGDRCTVANDCASGYCALGKCVSGEEGALCDDSNDCKDQYKCLDAGSQKKCLTCTMDRHCSTGLYCVAFQCGNGDLGAKCSGDDNCKNNYFCVDEGGGIKRCRSGDLLQPCNDHGDCIEPFQCGSDDRCHYCATDVDCSEGDYCVDYECSPGDIGSACVDDYDCDSGYFCVDEKCQSGGNGSPCVHTNQQNFNDDCNPGLTCDAINSKCGCAESGCSCNENGDCDSNLSCSSSGFCRSNVNAELHKYDGNLLEQKFKLVHVESVPGVNVKQGVRVDGRWEHPFTSEAVTTIPTCAYFKFNMKEWTDYFGSFTDKLKVKQCRANGSEAWVGYVNVFDKGTVPETNKPYPPHGRLSRSPGQNFDCDQWKEDDYIVKQNEPCMVPTKSDVVKISSAKYPHVVLGVSSLTCAEGINDVRLIDNTAGLADGRKLWKVNKSGGFIESVHCANYVIGILGSSAGKAGSNGTVASSGSVVLNKKNDLWSQKWNITTSDVVLREAGGRSAEVWTPKFSEPGYDVAIAPGFPGTMMTVKEVDSQCLSSTQDLDLARSAMRQCDESMAFLVGSQASVGRVKAIADLIEEKGPGRMPGFCCLDVSTNSDFLGYDFDPSRKDSLAKDPMKCQYNGPWHLGISKEACKNAGGEWFRSPCATLKETIDKRPSRFNLDNPMDGDCQYNLDRLETSFVSMTTNHTNFTFKSDRGNDVDRCAMFCQSLPDYSTQNEMMIKHETERDDNGTIVDAKSCTCMYPNGKLPSRKLLPKHATQSPPKFALINSMGMALGLRPNVDCTSDDDLNIEAQDRDPNSPRQQFQRTHDGRIVSWRCPNRVLSVDLPETGQCSPGMGLKASNVLAGVGVTGTPTFMPTDVPTLQPSSSPTKIPTVEPTSSPSVGPSESPTTGRPTVSPTKDPTMTPSSSQRPSQSPTTRTPSRSPTAKPTASNNPTNQPSASNYPSQQPSPECEPDCQDGQYCNESNVCVWKKGDGGNCLVNRECHSGFCLPDPNSEEYIPRCSHKEPHGGVCFDDRNCESGHCVTGYIWGTKTCASKSCQSHDECASNEEYCNESICYPKKQHGLECSSSDECQGMSCCGVCYQGSTPCLSSQYCDRASNQCVPKKFDGSTCSHDGECQGSVCERGTCIRYCESSNGCPSDEYCAVMDRTCNKKLENGESCYPYGNIQCKSGICRRQIEEVEASGVCQDGVTAAPTSAPTPTSAEQQLLVESLLSSNGGWRQIERCTGSSDGGDNSISVVDASGDTGTINLNYDVGNYCSGGSMNQMHFRGTSPVTGQVTLHYTWDYCHSWHAAKAGAVYLEDSTTTRFVPISNAFCPKSRSGSITLNLEVGMEWGITLEASNGDSARINDGSFKITLPTPTVDGVGVTDTLKSDIRIPTSITALTENYERPTISKAPPSNPSIFSERIYDGSLSDLQRWNFNKDDGSITNVGCRNLAISSSKEKDASLKSIYFSLQNPLTSLAMGAVGTEDDCRAGSAMPLQLQALVPGSPNQQFVYKDSKLFSVLCAGHAVEVPNDDCTANLQVSSYSQMNDGGQTRYEWLFQNGTNETDRVESVSCPGMFISIGGASGGEIQIVAQEEEAPSLPRVEKRRLSEPDGFSDPPHSATNESISITSYNSTSHKTAEHRNGTSYSAANYNSAGNYTPAKVNQTAVWTEETTPTAGSPVSLSSGIRERYHKWTKSYQVFRPLMGPFSLVNPSNQLAITADTEDGIGICANGMRLKAAIDSTSNKKQQFYMGKHGSLFSSACPGLVISADASNATDADFDPTLRLQTFRLDDKNNKWKLRKGAISSVNHAGMVVGMEDTNITLQENATGNPGQKWKRINTRMMERSGGTAWRQAWTMAFIDPDYDKSDVEEFSRGFEDGFTTCYKRNGGFSASFDDFAKDLVIKDASNEKSCQEAREQLGFDKDHPFDTEVRDKFYEHQCDPFFSSVDHTVGIGEMGGPPQFEMVEYTPVEYEAAEYPEEVEYKEAENEDTVFEADEYSKSAYTPHPDFATQDYDEFAKGDGPALNKDAVDWPETITPQPPEYFKDDPSHQESLKTTQMFWLMSGHGLATAEHLYAFGEWQEDKGCKAMGPEAWGPLGTPNPVRMTCALASKLGSSLLYIALLGTTIAFQALDHAFEIATLGPDQAIYGYEYSKATYFNTKEHIAWNVDALKALQENMFGQHTEMKKELQERHKEMTDHLGEDLSDTRKTLGKAIVSAQNSLGKMIVGSQNTLGEAIVNAQNVNGEAIVEARNANGQAIVDSQNALGNYIVDSQNKLSEFIVDSQNALGNYIIDAQNQNGQAVVDARNAMSTQHNVANKWLHGSLCLIFEKQGGKCGKVIGPLPEDQEFVPMELHWPEGQPTIPERLTTIERALTAPTEPESDVEDNGSGSRGLEDNHLGAIKDELGETKAKIDSVEAKLDAHSKDVESKVGAVESKVDAIQQEVKDAKDMIQKLMDMIAVALL